MIIVRMFREAGGRWTITGSTRWLDRTFKYTETVPRSRVDVLGHWAVMECAGGVSRELSLFRALKELAA